MSVLTDIFTSLANKIRSRLGTSTAYTPVEAISAIDDVYNKGVIDTKIGTATAEDVKSGKTFTNSSGVGISGTLSLSGDAAVGNVLSGKTFYNNSWTKQTGTMTNNGAVSQSLNCGGSYTVPAGYHNGSGKVTANSLASQTGVDSGKTAVTAGAMLSGYQGWVNGSKITGTFAGQEKTVTAGTSAASVTPDSGKYLTKVTYNPTPSQSKSASPSTSAQTISPDSGKLLSSVSISAISPQRAAGVAATYTGIDSTGPYVYFPYGWHPNTNSSYGNYTRLTAAQAVTACPKQEKTVTSSVSAQTVSPDSGKLLSKVTVNALTMSGTYTASSRGASLDMGASNTYRYVNTNSVPNTNSGTFTPTSDSSAHDMGDTNTYRYVNTNTVYNLGYANGWKEVFTYGVWHAYHGNKSVVFVSPDPYSYGRAKTYKVGGTSRNRNLNYSDDWVEAFDSNWNVIDRTHFPNSSSTTTYTEISWNAGSNRINVIAIYFGQYSGAYIEADFRVIFTF